MATELHTGFYSTKAKHIIAMLISRLDGSEFYTSKKDRNVASYCKVENAPDGEVIITYSGSSYDISYGRAIGGRKQADWLAWRLKLTVFKELERIHADRKHDGWDRSNTMKLKYYSDDTHDITVVDIYCMYDILRNRKKIENKYSSALLDELKGSQNDPFITQMEENRREEIRQMIEQHRNNMSKLNSEMYDEISRITAEIKAKYRKLSEEEKNRHEAAITELNEAFEATKNLAA